MSRWLFTRKAYAGLLIDWLEGAARAQGSISNNGTDCIKRPADLLDTNCAI